MKLVPIDNISLGRFFKIVTYLLLVFLILVSALVVNWHYSPEIIVLILFLCAYTLLLTLPIIRFKISPTAFEGELERLVKEREESPAPSETLQEVTEEVKEFSKELVENDSILMRLSIAIEITLRNIAESAGITRLKVSMGELSRILQTEGIIADPWLIEALDFFRRHRNDLIHEGKAQDIQAGIDIGREVLAKLRQIQKERSKK